MRGSIKSRTLSSGRRVWDVIGDRPRGADGKRRQLRVRGFVTRKEAETKLAELVTRIVHGRYVHPTKNTPAEYLVTPTRDDETSWLEAIRATVRPATLESYRQLVERYILPRLGGVRLRDLTPDRLNKFYADLGSTGRRTGRSGLSPRTVRYVHTVIRKALSDAVRWNKLSRNPADSADPPKDATPEMKTWNAEELRRFLEHVREDRLYAAWLVAGTTGMRRGEILGLKWEDLDVQAGRLAVRRALIPVGWKIEFSKTKTGRSRSVALDPMTLAGLREHRRVQVEKRMALGPAYEDQGLMFCHEDGSPIHPHWFSKSFRLTVRAAGLPPIRLHDLRHTHATLALAAGVHPKVVSDRLGHSTVAFTLDRYSHAVPALEESAAAKVADLVFGS